MWKDLMKYRNMIGLFQNRKEVEELLDTLEELIPIEKDRDRVGTFLTWIRKGEEAGLIDRYDGVKITRYIIDGPGGM